MFPIAGAMTEDCSTRCSTSAAHPLCDQDETLYQLATVAGNPSGWRIWKVTNPDFLFYLYTVDGQNPAPVGSYWKLWNSVNNGMIMPIYRLVQDFTAIHGMIDQCSTS